MIKRSSLGLQLGSFKDLLKGFGHQTSLQSKDCQILEFRDCTVITSLRSDWWYFANDSRLRFAALQSEAGRALLLRSGRAPDDISSLVLVEKDRFLLLWFYFIVG